MLALLELLLPKRATEQRVAVLIYPIGEVLKGYADAGSLPALRLSVVDKGPYLHDYLASTYGLFKYEARPLMVLFHCFCVFSLK